MHVLVAVTMNSLEQTSKIAMQYWMDTFSHSLQVGGMMIDDDDDDFDESFRELLLIKKS
jgi:hypothetical protein